MNKTRELTDLTACRALFALWVFAYHANLHAQFSRWLGPLGAVIDHGYLGVDGFFVLSGFILTRVDNKIPLTRQGLLHFWGKRLARLYPVHLAVIVLLGAIFIGGVAIGITPRHPYRFGTLALIENLALVQSWGGLHHWTWNYPSWSISTEWAGYLLFPFMVASLAIFFNLAVVAAMPLCFFILCVVAFVYHGLNLTFAASMLRFFPEFIAGMATVTIVPMLADEASGITIGLIGAALAAGFAWAGHDASTVFGLWLMIYGFAMQGDAERTAYLGRIKPLRALGIMSYSFYMSFAPAELVTAQLFRRLAIAPAHAPLPYTALLALLTLGLGIVLHVLIEKPARVALNRRLDPARAEALAEGSVPL
ncbi:MAG: acyltransferase [Acidiphilium sp. 37-64-53]|uniref:acyltransferase family protein n=1 Tax=Acidiphilium TaxID=522 RepID=UPI000BD5816D|nr:MULTISPECIES: acyltransferase [Acidiphilium]OYW04116.1 MAG: acyltransferase [Acidiphilium sp. 37-64-53]OZB31052.1 MAG: acyltransferase [Acidiphilium sp. 34-64-41]HQT83358.1 acyltransferase [Acidiphilium rubrum]